MNSYATLPQSSIKVHIPEIMGSGMDLSHCIDCTNGRRHIHRSLSIVKKDLGFFFFFVIAAIVASVIAKVVMKVLSFVFSVIKSFVTSAIKALSPVIKKLAYLAGSAMVYLNPITNSLRLLRSWKVTANLTKQVDRYTGGMITDFISVSSIPGRVVKGDKIPKEELIRDALFAIRVGAVVASGGTATAIVGATANQLQQGELGQSELGRVVLGVAQVVAVAAATGQAWQEVAKKQAVNTAGQAAAEEAAQETALGRSEAGRLLIGATLAGATASVNGTTAQAAVSDLAKSSSKQIAIREIAKELNIPYADKIAKGLVDNVDKLTNIDELKKILNEVDVGRALASVQRAAEKMPDVFKNIEMPDMSKVGQNIIREVSELPQTVVDATKQLAKETSEIPEDIAKAVSQLRPPTKAEIKEFVQDLKKIRSDFTEFVGKVCFTQNVINQATGVSVPVQICKNSIARLPIRSGNRVRYIYYFDDGSLYGSDWENATGVFKIAALVGAGLLAINQLRD